MRRFNKLLKSGTSLMLVFAMLFGMCGAAFAVGETETNGGYVALGDFVTEGALARFTGSDDILGGGAASVAYLYAELVKNQDAVAAADVIALGVGNADINIYAVNNVLGVIGKDVVGIGSVSYGTLEGALANCDALTRNAAMQVYDNLYGKLESAISERVTDAELVTTLLDILVYSAVSFVANYSAILEEVATVNPDATVMIVGLVNMLDGMVIEYNGHTIELGRYFGYVIEALNAYLAAVPTAMQMNGEYEGVTFLYAEASDAEVKYMKPVSVEGISKVVEELVWPTLKAELQAAIPSEVKGVKVDIKLENEDDTLTAFGVRVFGAICAEIEKAVCAADEPNPIVLSTDINLDGLFGDVSVDVNTDALTESAMEMVMDFYEAWQQTEEGQAITEACYNFMMGKVEEMIKAQIVTVEGDNEVNAYETALNEVRDSMGIEGDVTVDWAKLYNSLITAHLCDKECDDECALAEEHARELYDTYMDKDAFITDAVKQALLDSQEAIDAGITTEDEVRTKTTTAADEAWETAWTTLWNEGLKDLYAIAKAGYNSAIAILGKDERNANPNLPLALLDKADNFVEGGWPTEPVDVNEWIGDMRRAFAGTHVKTVEGLFNDWVNDAAAELVVDEIDGILDDVLAGEEVAPLMYLLGRLLVGDGLGRYITENGSDAIYYAMVAAYGDGDDDNQNTVQDEISDKVEKLIDLVLQNGPQAMNKVGAIDKIRAALDKMVEKLDGRGGDKVEKAVSEIESILDEIEAIANGESDKTAEDLVNAYIDLDATIDELRALIQGEEIPEDSTGAIREFIDAAAHGDYEIDYESYYVAIGDSSVEGYAGLLADELGLSNDYDDTLVSENVAASIENLDAEVIEKADLITVGFSGNTFFKYMASQVNAYLRSNEEPQEMDWATYVGAAGVKYVEKALNEIQAILAKDLHNNISSYGYLDEILMLAIESYAYASADYVFNYPALIEAIREINPDALIVSVGMNNALAGMTVNVSEFAEGYEFALGEYVEYLTAAVNGEAKVFAMLNENMAYVHAPDVTIEADVNEVYDYYDNMGIYDFMVEIGTIDRGGFAGLETSEEGNEYIKTKIYDALNITHGLRLGDINFDKEVDLVDLDMLYEYLIGRLELTGEQLYVADVDGVDGVTPADLTILYDYLIGRNTILA